MTAEWGQKKPEFFDSSFKKRLPMKGMRNVLITSALPYVNNVPHLGNIIGSVLSADVFSRYCQMQGYQSLYICGTDEYGTATEMKALKDGVSVQEICDKYHELHTQIYDWFNIDFDFFGRTTTNHQTEICQEIFCKVHENKFTSTSSLEQLHCKKCDKFLADRYVFGTCPYCKFSDARGDQCDGCGKLLDAVELFDPKCHICKCTPMIKQSNHIFLDLDRLASEVEKHFDEVTNAEDSHWSTNAIAIVKSWLRGGLEKRCITRDLKWGTPVPLKEFASKVFYVWFDAPIGYLSMTKALLGKDGMEKWWKNPEEVELYQFLGKDNVAFHGVIFPATLIATGEKFTKVRHLCATEYLNYEDKKFSKSRGTGVFGDSVSTIGVQADVWRFYLVYMRPENQDTAFCWEDFMAKVNSELNSNLGNFMQRSLMFVFNHFGGLIPSIHLTSVEEDLFAAVNKELAEYIKNLESVKLKNALVVILSISRLGNQYFQANEPWLTVKGSEEEKHRAATVAGVAANLSVLLSTLSYPFMPEISKQICRTCKIDKNIRLPQKFIQFMNEGHAILKPSPLFPKLDESSIKEWRVRFGTTPDNEKPQDSVSSTEKKLKKTQSKDSKKEAVLPKKAVMESFSNFKMLESEQNKINVLVETISKKLEKAKSLFIGKELEKLDGINEMLKQQVLDLKNQLGVDHTLINDICAVKLSSAAVNDANIEEKKKISAAQPKKNSLPAQLEKDSLPAKPKKNVEHLKSSIVEGEIDVGRLDMRVGRIVDVKKHPDADSLYVETIDLGEGNPRTVVSGLVKHVPLEQMQDRLVVCLCNLKPAKMRGVESQAMVMCASSPDKVEIMEVDSSCIPGDIVEYGSFTRRPDAVLNPKKKVWETVSVDLKVSSEGLAVYKDQLLTIKKKPMTAPTLKNVPVK